jgi:tyrosyl-tRNA synthetase
MSISDDTMWSYWTLLTDLRPAEIDALKADVADGKAHPKKVKMDLARRLVADFHGADAAARAEAQFETRFAGAEGAVEGQIFRLEPRSGLDLARSIFIEDWPIADVLVEVGLATSKNIARQKIREGAVATSKDGVTWHKVESASEPFELRSGTARHLRLGKSFRRVELSLSPSKNPSASSPESRS